MAGLRPFIIGVALVLLFTFCIFSFAVNFISINNPSSNFQNNSNVESILNNVNSTINDIKNTGNVAQNTLSSSTPLPITFVFLIFEGAFFIPKSLLSVVTGSVSIFNQMIFLSLFGQASPFYLVFAIFNFAMIITIVLLIIKNIRSGESER